MPEDCLPAACVFVETEGCQEPAGGDDGVGRDTGGAGELWYVLQDPTVSSLTVCTIPADPVGGLLLISSLTAVLPKVFQ